MDVQERHVQRCRRRQAAGRSAAGSSRPELDGNRRGDEWEEPSLEIHGEMCTKPKGLRCTTPMFWDKKTYE
ncbi:hypothetical protein EYF80_059826 [Liparis tanakae]|uniref:Uncharacterized protein n=1 Tax=Liparis tanakae TaxID=230148 RepID=A0A4Z2ENI6_9TELE|nr:hypothetical protein EYF80_059826 [Liparis tanakae]